MKNTPTLQVFKEEDKNIFFSYNREDLTGIDKILASAGYSFRWARFVQYFTGNAFLRIPAVVFFNWLVSTLFLMLFLFTISLDEPLGLSAMEIVIFSSGLSLVTPVFLFTMGDYVIAGDSFLMKKKAKALMDLTLKERNINIKPKTIYDDVNVDSVFDMLKELSEKYQINEKFNYDTGYFESVGNHYYLREFAFIWNRMMGKHKEDRFINYGLYHGYEILRKRDSDFARAWEKNDMAYKSLPKIQSFLEDFFFLVVMSEKVDRTSIHVSKGFVTFA